MKIAVWHNLPSGGGKRALFQHVEGLLLRGHEVEVWCPPTANQAYLPLGGIVPEHVVELPGASGNVHRSRPRDLRNLDRHCRACADEISRGGFDVFFAGPCIMTRSAPIARHVSIPSVLYLQEPHRELYECFPDLPWRALPPAPLSPRRILKIFHDRRQIARNRIRAREEWQNAKAFDAILVNSLFSRESVRRAYGLPASVCYLGIDTDRFAPKPVERESFVVSVGGLAFGKGADRVVRSLGAIDASRRPELVWIANFEMPEYRQEIEELANALGVQLSVRVDVSDDELIDTLSRCLAMIYLPVLEPFGFAPLEANACGAPVVAIAEGGVRETVVDGVNGRLVPDEDPEVIGSALLQWIDDPAEAARFGTQARKHVVDHWGRQAADDRLEAALRRVATP